MNPSVKETRSRIRKITHTALFLSLALVLSYLEHLLPVLPFLPPGVKMGLSNILVMFCLFTEGSPSALMVAILKSLFVFLTRGTIAGTLSLSGGLMSIAIMFLLSRIRKPLLSYLILSVFGAIFHNIGQLLAATFFVSGLLIYYLPALILSGILMGAVTGLSLRVLMPALKKTIDLPKGGHNL